MNIEASEHFLTAELLMRAYGNGALDGYNCKENNNPYEQGSQEYEAYNSGCNYGLALSTQDALT